MPYLFRQDFTRLIQTDALNQIIGSNLDILDEEINAACELAKSMLRPRFDINTEFRETLAWDLGRSYYAGERYYLDAPVYQESDTYYYSMPCIQGTDFYICIVSETTGTFASGDWRKINKRYKLYYAKYPHPVFDYKAVYKIGDMVWWADKVYTALKPTVVENHASDLQYRNVENIPIGNVFPDDATNGLSYWGAGTTYYVMASIAPDETDYYICGDNRDLRIKTACIDIALYELNARLAPANIPKVRMERAKGAEEERIAGDKGFIYPITCALGYLQAVERGNVTPSLPLLQPDQGMRIRFGGGVKKINSY